MIRHVLPLALLLLAAGTGNAAPADTISYTVKPGDTLYSLSRNFLVPQRTWQALMPLARARGPRLLSVGRTVAIPRAWLRYTLEPARLVTFRGTVAVEAGAARTTPTVGMTLTEGARIFTGPNSFATLILADQSRIALPSQSMVSIGLLRRYAFTNAIDYRFDLQQGRLQTKVTPLTSPSGRYRIDTPLTMTAVRGTEFRVSFDGSAQAAGTEVLDGTVGVAGAKTPEATPVKAGFGATTGADGQVSPATLLPAPDMLDPERVQNEEQVTFHLAPVAGAARYRVQLAMDAGFVDSFAEAFSPDGSFTLANVPNGMLFARVSPIAANGLEGQAQSYAFRRILATIHGAPPEAVSDALLFRWFGAGEGKRTYRFQLRRGKQDAVPIVDEVGLEQDRIAIHHLAPDVYYWRVGVTQSTPDGPFQTWAPFEKLVTGKASTPAHSK